MTAPLLIAMPGNEAMTRSLADRSASEQGDVELRAFPGWRDVFAICSPMSPEALHCYRVHARPSERQIAAAAVCGRDGARTRRAERRPGRTLSRLYAARPAVQAGRGRDVASVCPAPVGCLRLAGHGRSASASLRLAQRNLPHSDARRSCGSTDLAMDQRTCAPIR